MPDARTISMPDGVWAENADTVIPLPPVTGTAYRNPSVDLPEWQDGQRFGAIVDSAKLNQLLYLLTRIVRQIEQTGIPVWSPQTNYSIDSVAMGTDGTLYQATAASGPESGGTHPPPDAGYWKLAIATAPANDTYVLKVNGE